MRGNDKKQQHTDEQQQWAETEEEREREAELDQTHFIYSCILKRTRFSRSHHGHTSAAILFALSLSLARSPSHILSQSIAIFPFAISLVAFIPSRFTFFSHSFYAVFRLFIAAEQTKPKQFRWVN